MQPLKIFILLCLCLFSWAAQAAPNPTALSVWVNEAIVATYTYDYQNFILQQRGIAKYFTATGWTAYSKALNDAKLSELIQKNNFTVTSVARRPPQIQVVAPNQWRATMPLLVLYKNPQYEQKQILSVTIYFTTVPAGQGIRGLAISSLQSKVVTPLCQCSVDTELEPDAKETDAQQSPSAKQ